MCSDHLLIKGPLRVFTGVTFSIFLPAAGVKTYVFIISIFKFIFILHFGGSWGTLI